MIELTLQTILSFMLLGAVVGFMAGLLGIGGGGIMVPVLTSLFLARNVPLADVMHIALGTSMASIIVTSGASMIAHHQHQGVIWELVKKITPGVVLGTIFATYWVSILPAKILAIFFSVFMAYVSVQMFLNFQPKPERKLPGTLSIGFVGGGIGVISALVAIGGGTLTVPYLTWHNINLKRAIGTSAAVGFPIAIAGTIGYMINGWSNQLNTEYLYGYVYLPAVLLISMVSYTTAPMGAKMAHQLPIPVLKKIFACFLIFLSVKMLLSII